MKVDASDPQLRLCQPDDYAQICEELSEFWQTDDAERLERIRTLHHPMFLQQFRDTSLVLRMDEVLAGYLFGFLSQVDPDEAYVHFIAVRQSHRRRGLAARLYQRFMDTAVATGRSRVTAITTPSNQTSIDFHRSLGMELRGEPNADGVPVVRDYAGPGQDRVVLSMRIMGVIAP